MRCLPLIILLFTMAGACAQSSFQFGLLPSINLTKSLEDDFKLNFELESRQELQAGTFGEENWLAYDYLLTDLSVIATKKIEINTSLNAGYLLRFEAGQLFHRAIQQLVVTKNYPAWQLSHRFASDQTVGQSEKPTIRLRYRLASSLPLSGRAVDPREFYLKINNEYLNSWQAGQHDLEIRLTPFLGFNITNKKKVELGLDYRIDSFLESSPRHRFWIGMNWYQSI